MADLMDALMGGGRGRASPGGPKVAWRALCRTHILTSPPGRPWLRPAQQQPPYWMSSCSRALIRSTGNHGSRPADTGFQFPWAWRTAQGADHRADGRPRCLPGAVSARHVPWRHGLAQVREHCCKQHKPMHCSGRNLRACLAGATCAQGRGGCCRSTRRPPGGRVCKAARVRGGQHSDAASRSPSI